MKKAKLPLPVLILISATLFLFSSSFGEWIARPTSASPIPSSETVEEQQSAIVYVRVMAWLSQVISHPATHSEVDTESAQPVELIKAQTHGVSPRGVQLCALKEPSRISTNVCKSSRRTLSRSLRSLSVRAVPCAAAAVLRDSGAPAGGS
jgi:hypothetical protein